MMKMFRIIFLLPLACLTMTACKTNSNKSAAPPMLQVAAENLEGLDKMQWSEPKEMDGKKVREIVGAGPAVFTLPAWWGDAARPAQGDLFVLEIEFKDVINEPFIVSSFGNCANSLDSLSELHRSSAENNATWKTALIPVSYDYLYAGEGNPKGKGRQEFSIKLGKTDKYLPIASIKVRKSIAGDEERYNAETRAWVKKAQEKYTVADSSTAPQLPDHLKTASCIPYLRNYLSPLLPYDAPIGAEAGAALKIRMSQNEIECKQLGVYANGKDLEDVSIQIGDLKNEKGESFSGEKNLYTVEYALIKSGKGGVQLDAQRIWPLYAASVKANHTQAFWITVTTGEKPASPGLYKGEVNVLVKGEAAVNVPIEIEVMPVQLLTLDEAGLSMGGCVTGFVPFHNITYARKHNINSTNLWFNTVHPAMKKVNGKMVLDFTLIDEWMKGAKQRGLQNIVYFLGGNPYGFPKTMSIERELFAVMQDSGSKQEKIDRYLQLAADPANRNRVMKEIREQYEQWVREVTTHARDNGWPEIILTPFDEPAKHLQTPYTKEGYEKDAVVIGTGPWIKTHFEDACDIIRTNAPAGSRIYGSIHETSGIEFLPKINVFCTNAIAEDPQLGVKVNAAGPDKYFWQYTGLGSGGGSDPAKMRYSYGFYFGAFNSRGSLLWAYNWGNRFNTTEGYNWMICWDTPFGVIPTLSYEGMREAWDDRRYIETLKKVALDKGREKEATALLQQIFPQAILAKAEGGNDRVNDFWSATKNPEKLDEWRMQIADKIVEMTRN